MTQWRKSSFSDSTGACVEVAELGDEIAIRNSNHPSRGMLTFPSLRAFVLASKAGEFDDHGTR